MCVIRIIPLLTVWFVVGSPTSAYAQLFLSAGYNVRAVLTADGGNVVRVLSGAHTNVRDGPFSFDAKVEDDFDLFNEAVGERGRATAVTTGHARAQFGYLGAEFTANLAAFNNEEVIAAFDEPGRVQLMRSVVKAEWRDTHAVSGLTKNGTILPNGTLVILEGYINLNGALDVTVAASGHDPSHHINEPCCADGFAFVNAIRATRSPPVVAGGFIRRSKPQSQVDITVQPESVVSMPMLYAVGQTYNFGVALEVGGEGIAHRGNSQFAGRIPPGDAGANITSKFAETLTWGGITSVVIAETGEPVENWTITSGSGFDYSKPYVVPEPTSLALLSFALGAWWGWARPRRRCNQYRDIER